MALEHPVTKELFCKRLAALCARSGMSGFPKDEGDQHILLKSVALTIGQGGILNEQEINEKLKYWINRISQIEKLDHSSLRRWLIDAGYLTRSSDGSQYHTVASAPRSGFFDEAVESVDVEAELQNAREEIELRKQAYLSKAGKA